MGTVPHVYVVGSLNWDMLLAVERLPGPGETLLGQRGPEGPGGKGCNQAVAAARAGAETTMVGAVGDDTAGRELARALAGIGVTLVAQRAPDVATGAAVVMVDAHGENSIIVAPGANAVLTPLHVQEALDRVQGRDVVVAQGEVPAEVVRAAGQAARRRGAVFVLNLAPVIPVDLMDVRPDFLVVNEHEARELSGERPVSAWADALAGHGTVVVETLGAAGVRVHGEQSSVVPAVAAQSVVDTTGAGDAFVGAFAAGIAAGLSVDGAVLWGAAVGSITVAAHGAQGAAFDRRCLVDASGVGAPEAD